jgi:uncharacterized membrane protein YhaH (DUF805 family)
MIQSYKRFWKSYAQFIGKSTRSEYWYVVLVNTIIVFILGGLMFGVGISSVYELSNGLHANNPAKLGAAFFFGVILLVYCLAALIPNIAITMRRLQDAGFPWGLWFLSFIPYVGGLVVLVLCIMPTKNNLKIDR